jgi:1-acyl-sn-glycerol-3-phosphate acyltransferase
MFSAYICLVLFVLSAAILPFLPKRIMAWYMTNVVAKFLFLEGTVEGREKYVNFKNNVDKGIVIFSHPMWMDMFFVTHLLGEMSRAVIKSKYLIGPLQILANRLNVLAVREEKSGLSGVIKESVENRKSGEELITISPVGTTNLVTQDIVPEFKSKGTFLSMPAILPLAVSYSAFEEWDKQTLLEIILKRTGGPILYYHAKVMDPIFPKEDESMEDYMKRSRDYLESGVLECKAKVRSFEKTNSYIFKEFLKEFFCLLIILKWEKNMLLGGIVFCLVLCRVVYNTPQYDLLASLYKRILVLKIILCYLFSLL